jgi:hypothetical protein
VSAKTIKNKVAAPFRKCNFEIHFGIGIKEHEQIFDVLRKHGQITMDDKTVEISGSSTWKSLIVADASTGEVLVEKKFYKSDFDSIMADPEYAKYIDDLLADAMVRKMTDPESMELDPESYEEVRSVSLDISSDIIDPEE